MVFHSVCTNFVPDFRMIYEKMTLRELLKGKEYKMMELFDEENAYTALVDQWENYGTLRSTFGRLQGKNYIEDERRESLADSEVERSELLRQIFSMIRNTLTEQEADILCAYYGLQTKRLTVNKIAEKHLLSESRVLKIVRESERKLQFSDDAIEIWKYLYRR